MPSRKIFRNFKNMTRSSRKKGGGHRSDSAQNMGENSHQSHETSEIDIKSILSEILIEIKDLKKQSEEFRNETKQEILNIREEFKKRDKKWESRHNELDSKIGNIDNSFKEKINNVEKEISKFHETYGSEERCRWLEQKLDYLENQSRRNNVVIYGASEEERETWEDTEERVIHIVSQTGIKLKNSDIERAHRVGTSGENRPIVCKFLAYKIKEIYSEKVSICGVLEFQLRKIVATMIGAIDSC